MKTRAAVLCSLLVVFACKGDSGGGPSGPITPVVARVVFIGAPGNVLVGAAMTTDVRVALQDANGATVTLATNSVTLSLEPGGTAAVLGGTVTRAAVAGVATFTGLTVSQAGTFTLKAQSGSFSQTSGSFTVTAPVPVVTMLAFLTQPSAALAAAAMAPSIRVALQDMNAGTVTTSTDAVTISIATGAAGAVLGGTLTRAAVSGIATFDGIAVDRAGTYTLRATSGNLNVTSGAFTISVPSQVEVAVSAGAQHACGITSALVTWCWGGASQPVLGRGVGDVSSRFVPAPVSGGLSFKSVSAGVNLTCAMTIAGASYCWGESPVGDGTNVFKSAPTAVAGNLNFTKIYAGLHGCGLTAAGAAHCWGGNTNGEVGNGTNTVAFAPVPVSGGLVFTTLELTFVTSCGLVAGGAAYCWGSNQNGVLGDGTTTSRNVPTPVLGGLSFTAISSGSHTCGLVASGAAYCWGRNSNGQVGDGTTVERTAPVAVTGNLSFVTIRAGGDHTCGLIASGAAYCWGANAGGQLGDGTQTQRTAPTPVTGGLMFRALDVGALFTCGIATNNTMYCWGANNFGQLGNATNQNALVPTPIFGNVVF